MELAELRGGTDDDTQLVMPLRREDIRLAEPNVITFWQSFIGTDLILTMTAQQVRVLVTCVGTMLHMSTAVDTEETNTLLNEFETVIANAAADCDVLRPEDRTERLLVPLVLWASFRCPVRG